MTRELRVPAGLVLVRILLLGNGPRERQACILTVPLPDTGADESSEAGDALERAAPRRRVHVCNHILFVRETFNE